MHPGVWGKSMWQTMHAVALGYPRVPTEYQKMSYRSFFAGLGEVIPCESCAASYRRLLHKRGGLRTLDEALEASPRESTLFDWTVGVHNAVNAELGRGGTSWTPERARLAVMRGGSEGGATSTPPNDSRGIVSGTWKAMAVGFLFAFAVVALCVTLAASIYRLFSELPRSAYSGHN